MRKLALIFALLMTPLCLRATTVYVSSSGGSVSCGADGTQSTTAVASVTWTAGNTYKLCGTFTGAANASALISTSVTGTSGSPVTIFFETGANFTSPYWNSGTGAINISGASYVTIDGGVPCGFVPPGPSDEGTCNGVIQNTANGDSLANQQNSLGINATGCNNCTIQNLGIYNIYVHVNGGAFTNQDLTHCVLFSGTNFTVHDSDMHDNGFCLQSNYTNDTAYYIYNNDFYNNDHEAAIAGAAFTLPKLYFYGNHMHDWSNWDCPAGACHHDGLHVYNGSGGGVTTAYVYNNVCEPGSTGLGTGFNACIFLEGTSQGTPWTQSGTMYVFNNAMVVASQKPCVQLNIGTSNLFAHNTCISTDDNTFDTGFVYQNAGGTGSFSSVQNNAYSQLGQFNTWGGTVTFTGGASADCDYNTYVNSPGNGSGIWHWGGTATSVFSTWQGTGCDTHGTYTASGDLTLNSLYQPTTGSVTLAAGTNLFSLCNGQPNPGLGALCSDAAGNARPTSGAVTTGAYNQAGSTPQAATPTFSPVAGTYSSTQTVTISTTTPSAVLCYTTDGSTPTEVSNLCSGGTTQTYSTPVSVASTLTLKAIATLATYTDSTVGSALYTITGGGGGGGSTAKPGVQLNSGVQFQ